MQVTVIDVAQETLSAKNGRTFQQLVVSYKNDKGMAQAKKLVSFANPDLFKAAKSWTKDQIINVKTVKNEKTGYWDWVGLEGEAVATSKESATPTRVTGSNYETKEERAARQVYIIRQSSLATAVDLLGQGASTDTVIETAKVFEAYVLGNPGSFDDLADDIPE
ncbi:hypothetical protein EB001_14280 [bacterium]|jgi:hypothetical protein|nr:hypothetical protein [bacterium]